MGDDRLVPGVRCRRASSVMGISAVGRVGW
jgi:hypothetical protein